MPTIECRRSKIKVLHTTQDIKVSIKSTLFENIPAPLYTPAEVIDSAAPCLFSGEIGETGFFYVVVTHRNQKSVVSVEIQKHRQFPFGH